MDSLPDRQRNHLVDAFLLILCVLVVSTLVIANEARGDCAEVKSLLHERMREEAEELKDLEEKFEDANEEERKKLTDAAKKGLKKLVKKFGGGPAGFVAGVAFDVGGAIGSPIGELVKKGAEAGPRRASEGVAADIVMGTPKREYPVKYMSHLVTAAVVTYDNDDCDGDPYYEFIPRFQPVKFDVAVKGRGLQLGYKKLISNKLITSVTTPLPDPDWHIPCDECCEESEECLIEADPPEVCFESEVKRIGAATEIYYVAYVHAHVSCPGEDSRGSSLFDPRAQDQHAMLDYGDLLPPGTVMTTALVTEDTRERGTIEFLDDAWVLSAREGVSVTEATVLDANDVELKEVAAGDSVSAKGVISAFFRKHGKGLIIATATGATGALVATAGHSIITGSDDSSVVTLPAQGTPPLGTDGSLVSLNGEAPIFVGAAHDGSIAIGSPEVTVLPSTQLAVVRNAQGGVEGQYNLYQGLGELKGIGSLSVRLLDESGAVLAESPIANAEILDARIDVSTDRQVYAVGDKGVLRIRGSGDFRKMVGQAVFAGERLESGLTLRVIGDPKVTIAETVPLGVEEVPFVVHEAGQIRMGVVRPPAVLYPQKGVSARDSGAVATWGAQFGGGLQ